MKLVLASGSPRRTQILQSLGIAHEVDPADIDESVLPGERPQPHVLRLAEAKARSVAQRHPGAFVLAGDTVVVIDDEILGKPRDEAEAVAMLERLSGRTHHVVSGLALAEASALASATPAAAAGGEAAAAVHSRADVAAVTFRVFDRAEARAYVATGEPMDKAGAYAIQGLGAALVERFEGEYHTVVGLALQALLDLLERAGHPWRFGGIGN